ncbi:MAG: hypothetical protein HC880_07885 [Bacteroidia bacterium]|nr:hypothetical protein [Bacteroidia bacterium]
MISEPDLATLALDNEQAMMRLVSARWKITQYAHIIEKELGFAKSQD